VSVTIDKRHEHPTSPFEAIVEPRAALAKVGIHLRGSVSQPPEWARGEGVWPVLGPLYIVAETLLQYGFIELDPKRPATNPVWWKLNTRTLPPRERRAIRRACTWAQREWKASGLMWLESGARWLQSAHSEARERDFASWTPVIHRIVALRNNFWKLANGTMRDTQDGKLVDAYPRLAEFVQALDRCIDRILDTLRRQLIKNVLEDKLDAEQRIEAIRALQMHHDTGQWSNPERDISEIEAALGFETDKVVPLHGPGAQS
jgi:hypothetical protein